MLLLILLVGLIASPAAAEDAAPLLNSFVRAYASEASEAKAGTATLDGGVFRLDRLTVESRMERAVYEGIIAEGARVDDAGRFVADTVTVAASLNEEFEPAVSSTEVEDLVLTDVVLETGAAALDAEPLAWMNSFRNASASRLRQTFTEPDTPTLVFTADAMTMAIRRPAPGDYRIESTSSGSPIDFTDLMPEPARSLLGPGGLRFTFDTAETRDLSLGRGTLALDVVLTSDGLGRARVAAEFDGITAAEADLFGSTDDRSPGTFPDHVHLWRASIEVVDGGGVAALKRRALKMGVAEDRFGGLAADVDAPFDMAARALAAFVVNGGTFRVGIEPPTPQPIGVLRTLSAEEVVDRLRLNAEALPPQ